MLYILIDVIVFSKRIVYDKYNYSIKKAGN